MKKYLGKIKTVFAENLLFWEKSCIQICMQDFHEDSLGDMAPLAGRVYQRLKADLFDFQLLPGDRFTESEVAISLKVSRTPVREALMRLQKEGYLQMKFRAGWQVKPFDFRYYQELYDLRTILETASLRAWAKKVPERWQDNLKLLAQFWVIPAFERCQSGEVLFSEDEQFHRTLVSWGENREITRLHDEITERIRIIRRLDFSDEARRTATYQEHEMILEYLQKRQVEEACGALEAHIASSRASVETITLARLETARFLRYGQ